MPSYARWGGPETIGLCATSAWRHPQPRVVPSLARPPHRRALTRLRPPCSCACRGCRCTTARFPRSLRCEASKSSPIKVLQVFVVCTAPPAARRAPPAPLSSSTPSFVFRLQPQPPPNCLNPSPTICSISQCHALPWLRRLVAGAEPAAATAVGRHRAPSPATSLPQLRSLASPRWACGRAPPPPRARAPPDSPEPGRPCRLPCPGTQLQGLISFQSILCEPGAHL
jgi:hypothetical protein